MEPKPSSNTLVFREGVAGVAATEVVEAEVTEVARADDVVVNVPNVLGRRGESQMKETKEDVI